MCVYSFPHPIPQSSQADSCYHADGYISNETSPLAILEHLKALIGKGGEGGEPSTQTGGKEQTPRMRGGTEPAEQGENHPDEEASHEVDHQRAPRETLRTSVLHPGRDEVSQRASHEATKTYQA